MRAKRKRQTSRGWRPYEYTRFTAYGGKAVVMISRTGLPPEVKPIGQNRGKRRG